MRIGLLHDSILPPKTYGGIERIVMNLAEEYQRLGHEPVIIGREGSRISAFEFRSIPSPLTAQQVDELGSAKLDFLHAHQPLPVRPRVPFLVTIHGNGSVDEAYFANTNFLSQSHARNHNGQFYVFNGVDPAKYPFKERKDDYFVFLARTSWRVKNVKTAIRWAQDLGVRLEIIGGHGWSRGGIRYRGLIDEQEKVEVLSRARALIYPTNWDEPCAAAPLEALACGTPVIASANGCMPELIRQGTGVVCHSYKEMLDAKSQVEKIKPQACRESIEQFFSVSRMAADYLKLADRIIREGELPQQPRYNFDHQSVHYLYKPTLLNHLQFALRGKI